LPVLFAAGMTLLGTIDGAFKNFAYNWAFFKPVRKVFYNITITSLSVIVALVIGPISLIGVLSDKFTRVRAMELEGLEPPTSWGAIQADSHQF